MKKIVNVFLVTSLLFSMASCNLDQDPFDSERTDKAYTMEYVDGLRAGIYNNMAGLNSGGYNMWPDLYADVYNAMANNGNQGQEIYNHILTAQSSTPSDLWASYYGVMANINFAIKHIEETIKVGKLTSQQTNSANRYLAEMSLARAYTAHRVALLFCEDYCRTPEADKATADAAAKNQLGLPYPIVWDPEKVLERGNLYDFYQQVLADINAAATGLTNAGSQNSPYFTADAVTAFQAQIALHMHDFATAATKASSLYAKYPLINSKEAMSTMWYGIASTENIVQITANYDSRGTIGSMRDVLGADMDAATRVWVCNPMYVPELWIVDLFKTGDYRLGVFVTDIMDDSFKYIIRNGGRTLTPVAPEGENPGINPRMIIKFKGTAGLEPGTDMLSFQTFPKMFRIADMYLIEAEAQYRLGGDATTPLTTLATSRNATLVGTDVFEQLQNERAREMFGEGNRLFDLKRWNKDIARDRQTDLGAFVNQEWFDASKQFTNTGFTFPIPYVEFAGNPDIEQNPEFK